MFKWLFGGRKAPELEVPPSVPTEVTTPINAISDAPAPGEGIAVIRKLDASGPAEREGILPETPDENGHYTLTVPGGVSISVREVRSGTSEWPDHWEAYIGGVRVGGEYPTKNAAQQAALGLANSAAFTSSTGDA